MLMMMELLITLDEGLNYTWGCTLLIVLLNRKVFSPQEHNIIHVG